jgi:hypothetical protein
MLLAMALAVEEMVFAAWLLTKGLEENGQRLTPTARPHVPLAA